MPKIGPYSRPKALEKLDGRTRNGRLLKQKRAELTAHLGGNPSAPQRAIIDRLGWLHLHIVLIDERTAQGKAMTEHDSRTYLAWVGSYTRLLLQLGLKGAPERRPSLADLMASPQRISP